MKDSGKYAIPPEGRPLMPEGAEPLFHKFGDRARALGIDMMGNVTRVPNSTLKHVLLEWAHEQKPDAQHSLQGLCFEAYYAKDIFLNAENLAMLAGQAGYDAEAALAYLLSGQGDQQVRSRSDAAKAAGVNGIPHILVNDVSIGSGAKDPQTFKQIFLRAAAQR